ncbi:MAG TPA: amino acid ABC transporter permease [Candidatus Limnocylindrales bacterium]
MTTAAMSDAQRLQESIESSRRRRRRSFVLKFGVTWAVVLIGLSVFLQLTVGLNVPFLNTWAPFMLGFTAFPGGVILTLFISVVSIFFAVILATFGALGRLSSNPLFNGLASLYVSVVRGTPLIVQIFFIYLGLPAAGIVVPEIPTGIIALSFNYGAYLTEVFRAGIQAVPYGQTEAARSLGMTERQVMQRVVLPQAIRIVIPPVGNDFIAMTKDSALISVIGVQELLWRANAAGRPYAQSFQTIMFAAGVYWVMTIALSAVQSRIERRLAEGDRNR